MAAFSHLDRPKTSTLTPSNFALSNTKWGASGLGTPPAMPITYAFTPQFGGSDITSSVHIAAVHRAFADWAAVANIQFTQLANGVDADIDLYFQYIDGPDQTLGQAFRTFTDSGVPGVTETLLNVEVEFDSADLGSADGQYFYLVAVHEIGHALGLGHVDDPSQIMHDFYTGDQTGPGVGDIAGLQTLYGPPIGGTAGYNFGTSASQNIDTSSDNAATQIYGMAGDDTIQSGSGADTLIGGIGDDMSMGGAGRDLLFDPFGNDNLQGGSGEDNLYSPDGQNRLEGGAGNDALRGGIGNDTLLGGSGNDAIIADDKIGSTLWFGDDILNGGAGDDLLEGGSGQDVFVFAPNNGTDKIGVISFSSGQGFSIISTTADFQIGEDQLDVRGFGFGSAGQVMSKLSGSDQGAVFEANNTTVTLVGVDVDAISINDFIWA